jgi:hypothetical protein
MAWHLPAPAGIANAARRRSALASSKESVAKVIHLVARYKQRGQPLGRAANAAQSRLHMTEMVYI